jgi:hypothetical protein
MVESRLSAVYYFNLHLHHIEIGHNSLRDCQHAKFTRYSQYQDDDADISGLVSSPDAVTTFKAHCVYGLHSSIATASGELTSPEISGSSWSLTAMEEFHFVVVVSGHHTW